MAQVNAFTFVTFSEPNAPEDPGVRRLIRKQAMRKAADARIRNGNHGRLNEGQYPVFDEVVVEEEARSKKSLTRKKKKRKDSEITEVQRTNLLTTLAATAAVPANLFQMSYELMTMKYGLDATNISMLASIHINRAARQEFLAKPSHLSQILTKRRWSYFSYLPSRYGQSTCLNDATDCLVSRVRQIVSPDGAPWANTVLALYVRALNSLQIAIQCSNVYLNADVLCATAILSLFEFLNPSRDTAWSCHTAGLSKLIKTRGPRGFSTDFERAVFAAQLSPILTESILNNERCFLADDIWEPFFQSLVDKNELLSDRSQVIVDLTKYFACFCGLFKDVTSLVCGDANIEDRHVRTSKLRLQLLGFAEAMTTWGVQYEDAFQRAKASSPNDIVMEAHWTTMGIYYICTIFGIRLLGALSGIKHRVALEVQCQQIAKEILEIAEREQRGNLEVGLGLAQKVRIAKATQLTALEWIETPNMVEGDKSESELIEKWKFVHWCELFGRRTS